VILSGWGRYPRIDCRLVEPRDAAEVRRATLASASLIARGNGRSYGDAALNPAGTLSMLRSDRLLAFDGTTGSLTCEAGVLLSDILEVFVPRGWFPPVTPGTSLVSVGGMIAADVHGKNHHRDGSFGDHVESLDLMLADGRVVTCGPDREPELFRATCGGMGLTGVILSARFRLLPVETAYIRQETLRAPDLDTAMALFEASQGWTYTVAWIDCLSGGARLGRSLLYRGEHARLDELPAELRAAPLAPRRRRPLGVPLDLPGFTLNRWSLRAFNEAYYRRGRPGEAILDYRPYFYPLDAVSDWNRIYGRNGFVQFQCVLPKEASAEGMRSLLGAIAGAGLGSFLAVLKLFGRQGPGLLSFPMEGYTLALDFPATTPALSLLWRLDAIVAGHGGRLYLAKDARMGTATMRRGYPRLDEFQALRAALDPSGKFSSLQSERLGL
jgi:decaprenylphospho-beta-D-ribofuranose 2-oxidase